MMEPRAEPNHVIESRHSVPAALARSCSFAKNNNPRAKHFLLSLCLFLPPFSSTTSTFQHCTSIAICSCTAFHHDYPDNAFEAGM